MKAGAITASVMTEYLVRGLYGDKKISDLTADEKRLISSLVTIAGGLAGAAITDGNLSMAALAANTAKVEVENNSLRDKLNPPIKIIDINQLGPKVLDENGEPLVGGGGIGKGKIVNPATNKVVTEHIIVSSGKAPKTSTPNSIYEVSRADGTKSITYYDDKGRVFSREDYGQQRTHGSLGYDVNGKVPPHEHKTTYNERGFKDKSYYREVDENGKSVGPWTLDK